MEVAFLDRFHRVLARIGDPGPQVPQHHRSAAIFALGDDPLEIAIVERMILGTHGEAVFARVQARPLGHGPAFQHPVELEPEVPVQPGRLVLLHDEAVALPLELAPPGLLRLRKVALAVVGLDVELAARHCSSAPHPRPACVPVPSWRPAFSPPASWPWRLRPSSHRRGSS